MKTWHKNDPTLEASNSAASLTSTLGVFFLPNFLLAKRIEGSQFRCGVDATLEGFYIEALRERIKQNEVQNKQMKGYSWFTFMYLLFSFNQ